MAEEFNSAYTGAAIDAAVGAVRQKEAVWDGKQDKLTGAAGQLVGFNEAGEAEAREAQSFAGPAGPKGDTGKSAYETAVENGYTGTEQEWLQSLVGVQPLIIKGSVNYEPHIPYGSYTGVVSVSSSNFNRPLISGTERFTGFVTYDASLYYVEGKIYLSFGIGDEINPTSVQFSYVFKL